MKRGVAWRGRAGCNVDDWGELCFPEGGEGSSITAIAGQGHPKTPGAVSLVGEASTAPSTLREGQRGQQSPHTGAGPP